ncbi:hypothetical protein [uncultured Actinomyces sp.]|uniref:hypothetical protein n=1 Tax=uncultured Actinomyces sp. TaxID=249061 RepID=UPI003453798D
MSALASPAPSPMPRAGPAAEPVRSTMLTVLPSESLTCARSEAMALDAAASGAMTPRR